MSAEQHWCDDVGDFHLEFGQPIRQAPDFPDDERLELRKNLIAEEAAETMSALTRRNICDVADGLADLIYVAIGTALELGIDLQPVWDEVHRANMAKTGGPVRADGKVMKPEGWKPPNIRRALGL